MFAIENKFQEFNRTEGFLTFIIPLTFEPIEGAKDDTCTKLFNKIEEECYEDKKLKQVYLDDEDELKKLYESYKRELFRFLARKIR